MSRAVVSITNRCNLKCRMCDIGRQNPHSSGLHGNLLVDNELEPDQWLDIFRRLRVDRVDIVGVEPLLYDRLDALLRGMKKENIIVNLTTNGWLVERWRDVLASYSNSVTVSMDGMQKVHDHIRGVAGSFDRALAGVRELKKAGVAVRVSSAITPENTSDMFSLYTLMQTEGVPMVFNHYNYIHPVSCKGTSCKPANMGFDPSSINIRELYLQIGMCEKASFLPDLRSKRELAKYYRQFPTRRKRAGHGCIVLEEISGGKRYVIAPDGSFLPGNRCWLSLASGNALSNNCYTDLAAVTAIATDIRAKGFFPPCQRLCCSGKVL